MFQILVPNTCLFFKQLTVKNIPQCSVVVAQSAKRLLPIQRSAVRIQPSAKFDDEQVIAADCLKDSKIEKIPAMVHFNKRGQ